MNHPLVLCVLKHKHRQEALSRLKPLQIISTEHQSNPRRVAVIGPLPIEKRRIIIAELFKNLPGRLMTSVKSWTKNRSCLVSFEIPCEAYKNLSLDLFPDNENHWSIRSIKNRQTTFENDEEMMDFIHSENSSTAGLFNIHLQSPQDGYKYTYFIAVIPVLPENLNIRFLLLFLFLRTSVVMIVNVLLNSFVTNH
jgi:hypothetical protein